MATKPINRKYEFKNGIDVDAALLVNVTSASVIPATLKGASSQTADLQEWQNSAAAILGRMTAGGVFVLTQNAVGYTNKPAGVCADFRGTSSQVYLTGTDAIDGGYILGGGNALYVSTGVHWDGSTWKADQTAVATIFGLSAGSFTFYATTATTVGTSAVLNTRGSIDATGHVGFGAAAVSTTGLTIVLGTASNKGVVVKGASSQSGTLQEWQDSAGTALATVTSVGVMTNAGMTVTGTVGVNGTATGIAYTTLYNVNTSFPVLEVLPVTSTSADAVVVKAATSQTGALLTFLNTSSAAIFAVTVAGLPKWSLAGNQQTTVGAAGGASALPATPTKYLKVVDSAGTTLVVPAYAAS